MLDALLSFVQDLVAPTRCVGCNEISAAAFCAECDEERPVQLCDELDGVPLIAAGLYTGPLAVGIRRFKYERAPALARPLASLLLAPARGLSLSNDVVWVPVPLHYARLVERGFNQSALLASRLASATGGDYSPLALKRQRETAQQAELDRAARLANMSGAFVVRSRPRRPVVLVDDVVTTGATVRACLRAFELSGVDVRAVFTLARTHPL